MDRINPDYLEFSRLNAQGSEAMQLIAAVLAWYRYKLHAPDFADISALVVGLGLWMRVQNRVVEENVSIIDAITAEKLEYPGDLMTALHGFCCQKGNQ